MPYSDRAKKLEYDRKYKEERKMRGYCLCGRKKEDRRRKWCYSCKPLFDKYESDKSYREKNPVRIRGYGHTYNQKLRAAAIIAYGGYRCSCPCGCDVTEKEYLALDHIDGGGTEHRKQVNHNIYSWLKTNDYPPGFRVLCHNCNMARGFYGYCPREKTSPEVVGELERGRETPSCFAAEAVESVLVATR